MGFEFGPIQLFFYNGLGRYWRYFLSSSFRKSWLWDPSLDSQTLADGDRNWRAHVAASN